MFCAPGLVFGGIEGVRFRFNVLFSRTLFRRYSGRRSRFHVLRSRNHFRRYRRHVVPFSCFVLQNSFSAVPRASCFALPDSFSAVPRATVQFSCFALLDSFSTVPRASGPFLMFCAHGLIFDGSEGVVSLFHVLCSRTRFRRYPGRQVPF
jgi:hypothetical protein